MGSILSNIGNQLTKNKTIMRCLNYDHVNALSSSIPDVSISEIIKMAGKGSNPNKEQRIFKFLVNDNIIEEVRTELRFGVSSIKPDNLYLAEFPITFQVITHNTLWELDNNKIRVFEIISEILKDLNGNESLGTIGGLKLLPPVVFAIFNRNFSGYIIEMLTRTK